jgi:hypothetical protein
MSKTKNKSAVKSLWEILVPKYSNTGIEYSLEHHQKWDEQVRGLTGGLTILKKAKGQWINPEGRLFAEEMIPVRINCTRQAISRIVDITLEHYEQEAVLAYEISHRVILRYRKPQQ